MPSLDEIIKQLQHELDDTNVSPYDDEWVQGYERGKESAYRDCIELLNKYNPWHMYPQEKPTRNGPYNVTTSYGCVQPMTYENGNFYTEYAWVCTSQNDYVMAWMELPKPYKREVSDESMECS